ncbi:hypothetical protein [Geobacter benzoatilyticus]|uniref:Uncharacterized protein n=1 Tax=Geobacter benzoatilyticus TaxID=2815309 RepID=A0ABX7Q4I3_9BACT|nr:hypothetical protein [Geobacter benzoatilyticus]QSV46010.1 hypothetical protein JZM60_01560 [Geobacter benzoatilyticus]
MPNAIIAIIAHTTIINTINNVIGFIPSQAGTPFSGVVSHKKKKEHSLQR